MTQKLIVSATSRGVVTMSISRPEKSNALDGETLALLFAACERVEKEASARVIVLRGAGKDFCSGADVGGELSAPDSPNTDRQFSIDRVCSRLNALPKPTIAVVRGACIGGGLALAACCDVVLATPDTFFAIPEVRLGFPPVALLPIFASAFSTRFLRRYLLAGDRFNAEQAFRAGLVNEICVAAEMDDVIEKVIESFLQAGPGALAGAKTLLIEQGRIASELPAELHRRWLASDEAREGLASFRQRRHPNWYSPKGN